MASSTSPSTSSLDKTIKAHDQFVEKIAKEVTLQEKEVTSTDASSVAPSLEKEDILAGFQDDVLPEKEDGRAVRFLRHQVFTLYRKLFSVVFLTNLGIFIWLLVRGTNAEEVAGVTVANLFVSILHRQDYVINAYFWLFTRVPLS